MKVCDQSKGNLAGAYLTVLDALGTSSPLHETFADFFLILLADEGTCDGELAQARRTAATYLGELGLLQGLIHVQAAVEARGLTVKRSGSGGNSVSGGVVFERLFAAIAFWSRQRSGRLKSGTKGHDDDACALSERWWKGSMRSGFAALARACSKVIISLEVTHVNLKAIPIRDPTHAGGGPIRRRDGFVAESRRCAVLPKAAIPLQPYGIESQSWRCWANGFPGCPCRCSVCGWLLSVELSQLNECKLSQAKFCPSQISAASFHCDDAKTVMSSIFDLVNLQGLHHRCETVAGKSNKPDSSWQIGNCRLVPELPPHLH